MKQAVILVARREKDTRQPYPLEPIDGNQNLIDRLLFQLRELGYGHIILVVGFQAHLFDSYRAEDVEIVYNSQYQFTGSMASLALSFSSLHQEDFILIEGDTFFEKRVLDELDRAGEGNCLAIADESGSGDEAYVECQSGFVRKISKDMRQIRRIGGELLGIAKLSYRTLVNLVDEYQRSSNPYLNYEYLLLDTTELTDRPYIYFKDLIWGDVDHRADLERLRDHIVPRLRRKENVFDPENIFDHLRCIFPDQIIDDTTTDIHQIGGLSNKNFKVSFSDRSYVLRLPGLGAEGMVERSIEDANSQKACLLNLNPPIVYFDTQTGVKLAEFIPGAETLSQTTLQRPEHLREVAQVLATLHEAPVRFANDFNVFQEIRRYERLLDEASHSTEDVYFGNYRAYRSALSVLESRLDSLGVILAPCHNDTIAENFIKSATGKIYLIDWEYSGMNDPMWDVAALFLESSFSSESEEFFLEHYLAQRHGKAVWSREKILIYQILMDWLWAVWTLIKEANGDNFGTYGETRFARALNNLEKWRNEYGDEE